MTNTGQYCIILSQCYPIQQWVASPGLWLAKLPLHICITYCLILHVYILANKLCSGYVYIICKHRLVAILTPSF